MDRCSLLRVGSELLIVARHIDERMRLLEGLTLSTAFPGMRPESLCPVHTDRCEHKNIKKRLPVGSRWAFVYIARRPPICTNRGANTTATMVMSLIRMLMEGPEVSLKGSPTVSPITAAACVGEPLPP